MSPALFFMPSFYGLVLWSIALAAYMMRLIAWHDSSWLVAIVFAAMVFCYATSVMIHWHGYRAWYRSRLAEEVRWGPGATVLATLLHALGLLGLAMYWGELARVLGSFEAFIFVLVTESHLVRESSQSVSTIGVQLSYFGWTAIALTIVLWVRGRGSWLLAILAAVQFAGNVTFVDRTRPFWILTCAILTCMALDKGQLSRRPSSLFAALMLFGIAAFVMIGFWVGKAGGDAGTFGHTALEGMPFSFYLYLTSGLAYANDLFQQNYEWQGIPERVIYPIAKTYADLFGGHQPAPQINDFVWVPYPTNVGTALEPFYTDAGPIFLLLGMVLLSFGFDRIGLNCLQSRRFFAVFFWSNLCFASLVGFFTPKIGTTPFWLFMLMALAAPLWTRSPQRNPPAVLGRSSKTTS